MGPPARDACVEELSGSQPGLGTTNRDRVVRLLARHRRRFIAILVFSVASTLATVGVPYVLGLAVDAIEARQQHRLDHLVVVLLIVGLVGAAVTFVARLLRSGLSWTTERELREAVSQRATEANLHFVERFGAGQILTRATVGAELAGYFLGFGLAALIGLLTTAIATVIAMALLSPWLALSALVPLPLVWLGMRRYNRVAAPVQQEVLRRLGDVTGQSQQDLDGIEVVKTFGIAPRRLRQFASQVDRLFARQVVLARIRAVYQPLLIFVAGLANLAVFAVGIELTIRGDISTGTFVAEFVYLGILVNTTRTLGPQLDLMQSGFAALAQQHELLAHEGEDPEADPLSDLAPGPGRLNVENVCVLYGDREALVSVDLEAAPGSTIAVVGASGAGKSSLVRALWRADDLDAGRIELDGTDISDVPRRSLMQAVGVTSDEPALFRGTLRDNLRFGRPEATDAELLRAASAAGLDDVLATIPGGLDAQVGEGGLTLSGGERQRVALARTLVHHPRLLVLDDATASVDAITEQQIVDGLRQAGSAATQVVITPRPSWLARAKEVILLDGGRVRARGSHAELLESEPAYRAVIDVTGSTTVAAETRVVRRHSARAHRHSERPGQPPAEAVPSEPPAERGATARMVAVARMLVPYGRRALIALGVLVIATAATLALPVLVGRAVDDAAIPADRSAVIPILVAYLVVSVVGALATGGVTYLVDWVGARALSDLRVRLVDHVLRLPLAVFRRLPTGEMTSRVTNDVQAMTSLVSDVLVTLISSLLVVALAITIMLSLDLDLTALTLAVFPVLLGALLGFRFLSVAAYRAVRVRVARASGHLHETMAGLEVVRQLAQEARREREFAAIAGAIQRAKMRTTWFSVSYYALVEALLALALAVVLYVGGRQVFDGSVALGVIVTFAVLLGDFVSPVAQLSELAPIYQASSAAFDHITELLDEPTEPPERANVRQPPDSPPGIRYEGVGAGYEPGRWAVRDIDVEVPPGGKLAIVGRTGSGKSTLVRLLPRLYETRAGTVSVDGTDVCDLDREALRRHVGLVPQDAFLFDATVRANLTFASPGATDEELASALATVGLRPDGPVWLDTACGMGGRKLSASQRQLVSLARVLVSDPPIVILDEVTARMDPTTEARLRDALTAALDGRTVIAIAHRLSMALWADEIAVVHEGRIVERGTHEELIAKGGRYTELFGTWSGAQDAANAPQSSTNKSS